MKKLLKFLIPAQEWRRLFLLMLPAMLLGWLLFPIPIITYVDFIIVAVLIGIWIDIMEIRNKLNVS